MKNLSYRYLVDVLLIRFYDNSEVAYFWATQKVSHILSELRSFPPHFTRYTILNYAVRILLEACKSHLPRCVLSFN